MEIEYKFEKPKDSTQKINYQKNLHVARSCNICKYFALKAVSLRNTTQRGFCVYPLSRSSKDMKIKKVNYPKTHAILVCDNFEIFSEKKLESRIKDWLDKSIMSDGTIKEE